MHVTITPMKTAGGLETGSTKIEFSEDLSAMIVRIVKAVEQLAAAQERQATIKEQDASRR